MIIMDRPESIIAIGIILFIAVIAFISTVSSLATDKENKKLRKENEILKAKCVRLTEYSAELMHEKEQTEYKQQFEENLTKLNVGDENV